MVSGDPSPRPGSDHLAASSEVTVDSLGKYRAQKASDRFKAFIGMVNKRPSACFLGNRPSDVYSRPAFKCICRWRDTSSSGAHTHPSSSRSGTLRLFSGWHVRGHLRYRPACLSALRQPWWQMSFLSCGALAR